MLRASLMLAIVPVGVDHWHRMCQQDKAASKQTKPNKEAALVTHGLTFWAMERWPRRYPSRITPWRSGCCDWIQFPGRAEFTRVGWICDFWMGCLSSHTLFLLWLPVNKKGFWVAHMSQWSPLCINRLTLRTEWDTLWPPLTLTSPPSWHPSFPLSQYVRVRDESAKWEGTRRGSWH